VVWADAKETMQAENIIGKKNSLFFLNKSIIDKNWNEKIVV
jgi:hypothetical protein